MVFPVLTMKVFVTRKIPEPGLEILRKHFEVDVFEEKHPISRVELIERASGCDGLLPLLTDPIDAEIMDETGIKAIANYAVGYDNINISAATERKIPVTNTPGVLTDATADLTFALILAVSRRIVEADNIQLGKGIESGGGYCAVYTVHACPLLFNYEEGQVDDETA